MVEEAGGQLNLFLKTSVATSAGLSGNKFPGQPGHEGSQTLLHQ